MAGVPEGALAVAVSGGGDSMALLHLMAERGPLRAVTVDHGLRDGAAEEAAMVAEVCAGLAVPHDTLKWQWNGQGNLQARARLARQRLIADWAAPLGITHVALAHTADDQAETVLMRLGREAGVDGLSGMAAQRQALGLTWLRPLLDHSRAELRALLRARGATWAEDPSNEDPRFDRVKARQAMAALAPLGITRDGLTRVAAQMAEVREALDAQLAAVVREHTQVEGGDVVFFTRALAEQPQEIQRRLLAGALRWVASADYAPRRAALARVQGDIAHGRPATVHGCLVLPGPERTRITRELRAVADLTAPMGQLWDQRWRATGPAGAGLELRALGAEGQLQCPELRERGLPHASRLSLPGLWRKGQLLAAPLCDLGGKWRVELAHGAESFAQSLKSH